MQNGQSLSDFLFGNNNFEAQLQQRMALAKQQGWSDDQIQQSAAMERAMNQYQQQQQAALQPNPPQQQQGGNFFTHLISMLGGAGGAAGGAALGTAIMPGIGTIIGGGLGGLLGGFGGSAVQQKVENNNVNWGDALKTGGLDALFSAGGEALGPMLGLGASEARGGAGLLETAGKDLQAGGLGLAQGAKAAGMSSPLGAQASDNLVNTLKNLKVPLGSPESTQRALEPVLQNIGSKISSAYASADVPVTTQEINQLGTSLLQKVASQGGMTGSAEDYALQQAQKLANVKSINDLWQFRQGLDSTINFGRNAASSDPLNQQVATMMRDDINNFLNAKVPGLADLNQQYSAATTANNLLKASSRNTGGGVVQRLMTSAPIKGLETKAGGALETLGKATAGTGTGAMAPVTAVTRQAAMQLPPNLQNLFSGQQTAAMPTEAGATPTNDTNTFQALSDQLGAQAQQQAQPTQSTPYSSTDLATAAERALLAGNSKAASALDSAAQEAAKVEAANSTAQKLTTAQQKDIASVKNASQLLDAIEQQFGAAGGGQGPLGYLYDIPGIGQYLNQNMGAYNQTKVDAAVAFAKAMMGSASSGGSNQTLIKQVSDALPKPTDTPAMAKQKLANLRQELQGRAQTVLTYPYTSADLPSTATTLSDLLGSGGSSSSQMPVDLNQLFSNTAL